MELCDLGCTRCTTLRKQDTLKCEIGLVIASLECTNGPIGPGSIGFAPVHQSSPSFEKAGAAVTITTWRMRWHITMVGLDWHQLRNGH